MNRHHTFILDLILQNSGQGTQHTYQEGYLGNPHLHYPINAPTLRLIAKEWLTDHKTMKADDFQKTLNSLIHGKSATEKYMAGVLLDMSTPGQRIFDPVCFEEWLDHLIGWAEVDVVCTGDFTVSAIPGNFVAWKKILLRLSKSTNINKRRASLVFLCSPLRNVKDDRLADLALQNIERLKHEKEILITKAISWLLRSMVKHYKAKLKSYVMKNQKTLPAIAVRETLTKIRTGKKNPKL